MSRRPRAIVLAVVLALAVAAALVGWLYLLPRYVEQKATRTLRERFGLDVEIADVSVGLGGVELEGVRGGDGPQGALRLELERVRVSGAPWRLRRGLSGSDGIEIGPGVVRISLRDEALLRLLRRSAAPDRPSGGSGARARSSAPIAVRALRVVLEDARGTLTEAVLDEVSRHGSEWTVRARTLTAGASPGDRIEVGGLSATARREGRWRLGRVDLESIDVRWASGEAASEAAPTSLVRRLEDAADVIRRGMRGSRIEEDSASDEPPWARRIASDFRASIARATFEGASVAGTDDRLSFAGIGVARQPGNWLRCTGEGRGSRVGAVRWSLRAQPDLLRAEGRLSVEDVPLALLAPLLPDIPWYPSPGAKVSADLDLRTRGLEAIDVRGSLALGEFAVSHPRLAAAPIRNLGFRIGGEGTFYSSSRRLELRSARITLGDAHVDWVGTIERPSDHYRVDGTLSLPPTPCDAAVHAIPEDILGPLVGMRLSGMLAGRMAIRLDSRELERTVLDFAVEDGCSFTAVPPEADVGRFAGPFLHQALEPDGTVFEMETGPGTGNWVSLLAVSPLLQEAVVSHEDAAFFRHEGFAPWAIRDALVRNLEEGRYVVGASTITMQLVKNLFLRREKTLVRKIEEVLLTWWIEKALDKPRILELYLNVIEYGPSVYGIRNATRHYFGREPMDVSPAEAAFLATILPAPKSYAAMYESGTISASTRSRVERFLRHLASQQRISPEALEYGLHELETFRFHRSGNEAPEPRFFREDFSGVFENTEPPPDDAASVTEGWDPEP